MTEGFSAVPNWMIRDESISLYAIAVYTALASHSGPGGIHPSQKLLAVEARCSERQVRYALDELERLGVVERVRRKDAHGRASNGYILHPNGRLAADEELAEVTAPPAATSEVTAHGAGGNGTRRQSAPLIEEEPNKKIPPTPHGGEVVKRDEVLDVFERVWSAWPRKEGKKPALLKFRAAARRAPLATIEAAALASSEVWRTSWPQADWGYIPHLATWLNQDRWDDPPPQPRAPSAGKPSPRSQMEEAAAELERRRAAHGAEVRGVTA